MKTCRGVSTPTQIFLKLRGKFGVTLIMCSQYNSAIELGVAALIWQVVVLVRLGTTILVRFFSAVAMWPEQGTT